MDAIQQALANNQKTLTEYDAKKFLAGFGIPVSREVLAEVKNDPNLRQIPVVVLTTSRSEQDVLRAYDLHANCYITKPVDFKQFMTVVKSVEDFWLTVVKLPSNSK